MSYLTLAATVLAGYNYVIPIARYSMLETGLTLHSTTLLVIASTLLYCVFNIETFQILLKDNNIILDVDQVLIILNVALLIVSIYNFVTEIRGPRPATMNLKGKVYIVTGANSGIGLETARRLTQDGAHVIMGCRSASRAQEALKSIQNSASKSGGKIEILRTPLDLTSLQSVQDYCEEFLAKDIPLHGLICNAGMIPTRYELSVDGTESGFAANHLGHFHMSMLLLSKLSESSSSEKKDPSRIVILSSSLHKLASASQACRVATKDEFSSFPVYARAKLANLLFMRGLINHIEKDTKLCGNITVNSVHPGNPCTNFTSNLNGFLRFGEAITLPLMYLIRETPYAGAFCSVFAATSPTLYNQNGLYLVDSVDAPVNKESYDKVCVKELWDLSNQLISNKFAK